MHLGETIKLAKQQAILVDSLLMEIPRYGVCEIFVGSLRDGDWLDFVCWCLFALTFPVSNLLLGPLPIPRRKAGVGSLRHGEGLYG